MYKQFQQSFSYEQMVNNNFKLSRMKRRLEEIFNKTNQLEILSIFRVAPCYSNFLYIFFLIINYMYLYKSPMDVINIESTLSNQFPVPKRTFPQTITLLLCGSQYFVKQPFIMANKKTITASK